MTETAAPVLGAAVSFKRCHLLFTIPAPRVRSGSATFNLSNPSLPKDTRQVYVPTTQPRLRERAVGAT